MPHSLLFYVVEPGPSWTAEQIVASFKDASYGRTLFRDNLNLLHRRFERIETVLLVEEPILGRVVAALEGATAGTGDGLRIVATQALTAEVAPVGHDLPCQTSDAVFYQRGIGILQDLQPGHAGQPGTIHGAGEPPQEEAPGFSVTVASVRRIAREEAQGSCLIQRRAACVPCGCGRDALAVSEIPFTPFQPADGPPATQFSRHLHGSAAIRSMDGPVARLLLRRVSSRISRPLARRGVHPNLATVAAALFAVSACVLFSQESRLALAAGGFLWLTSAVLDQVDGELARLQAKESEFGAWLDLTFDRLLDGLVLVSLAWPLLRGASAPGMVILLTSSMVLVATNSYLGLLYDQWMKKTLGRATYFRIGRDTRNVVLFACALAAWRMEAVVISAALSAIEIVRRLAVLRRHERRTARSA